MTRFVFQSTLPAREATQERFKNALLLKFQSTLPAREATWSGRDSSPTWQFQSTLPAGEATISTLRQLHMTWIFQSTLPAGEATAAERVVFLFREFQSTLPAGEATQQAIAQGVGAMNFNPRFPRGKRQRNRFDRDALTYISIHASRGGSDNLLKDPDVTLDEISIHASRGGSDQRLFL